ncbi:MAG: hypothetical protein JNK57_02965 [Planctomycetaceae bacterium]|jgi:hypothetical protein|nr:hypothetical protein [Planctomycetaceae bacterium]
MRVWIVVAWLFVGLAGVVFHLGPGRELEKNDLLNANVTRARLNVETEKWGDAIDSFDEAIAGLSEQQLELQRQLRLEKAKAQMMDTQLPEARLALDALMQELVDSGEGQTKIAEETRLALASAQYYVTWLMRLEGVGREEWEPEVEAARQNYRILSEMADESGDADVAEKRREDLEATVRLARMDLTELQALPLPSQCQGCKSGKCRGKKPGKPKEGPPKQGATFQKPSEHNGS